MKKPRKNEIIPTPGAIAVLSTMSTIVIPLLSNFGRLDIYRGFGRSELAGSIFIIISLLMPIFVKKYRKEFWSKKGLIIFIVALAINLPIGIYSIINHYNLYGLV